MTKQPYGRPIRSACVFSVDYSICSYRQRRSGVIENSFYTVQMTKIAAVA